MATSQLEPNMKIGRRCNHVAAVFAIVVLVLANYLAAARNQDSAQKQQKSVYAVLSKAPQKAVTRRNPLENDPDAVVAGGKLFEIHCSECHGDMAEGGRRAPSLVAEEVQQATPGTLFWILTNGVVRRGMPVWSKLPEPQRWQIVRYLKSLAPPKSPPISPENHSKTPGTSPHAAIRRSRQQPIPV
jgi:mono/diheme cytochrome c family protein